jgi:hypothetical protein
MKSNLPLQIKITDIESLRQAQQYHQVKIVEKEALIMANVAILKSQYGSKGIIKTLFNSGTKNMASSNFLSLGTDWIIDMVLGGKSPFVRLFSKNIVRILSSNYNQKIQSFLDRIMRTFSAVINR